MDSHDGKRRSHQRFLRNLPKQKVILSSVVEVILSSVADPDNLGGGGGGGGLTVLSLALPAFPLSAILFFFFTQNKEGLITYLNYSPLKNQNLSISFFNQQKAGKGK